MKNILALVPNWLGDVVMCTPALRALHRRFPDAEITVAGRGVACEVLRGLPWLHRFVTLPARQGAWGMARSSLSLRSHSPELAVVFPHSFRAALLARMTGAGKIVGYARGGRSTLLSQRVEPHRVDGKITPVYMVEEYLDLVSALGCEVDGFGLELAADGRAVAAVREHLIGTGPFVGIAPGAAYGPSKRWSATRFAEVADELRETADARCVLLTGPGE
ncbi:MAG: glycosyltransferase family 9 protein, partial [Candidatus Hydrogenedentes bacterium]|nr:glycosyltransferase family 9 protein [Candidatus Hydrogenedentota bacterium]